MMQNTIFCFSNRVCAGLLCSVIGVSCGGGGSQSDSPFATMSNANGDSSIGNSTIGLTTTAEQWPQQSYSSRIRAQSAVYDQQFGRVMAVSGNGQHMAVGSDLGGIEMFVRDAAGSWRFDQLLESPIRITFSGQFGDSFAFTPDGSRLVIGVPDHSGETYRDEFGLQVATTSGAVLVYDRVAIGGWQLAAVLSLDSYRSFDHFGQSVAVSGDGRRIVASAPGRKLMVLTDDPEKPVSTVESGTVYVYDEVGSAQFEQTLKLQSPDPAAASGFGSQLLMARDASKLFVLVPGDRTPGLGVVNPASIPTVVDSSSSEVSSGNEDIQPSAVYVYQLHNNGTSYELDTVLKTSLNLSLQSWGASLAIDGNGETLVVGSTFAAYDNASLIDSIGVIPATILDINQGMVTIYKQGEGQWRVAQTIGSPPTSTSFSNLFGSAAAISVDGELLAIGMPGYWEKREDFDSLDAGIVFTYRMNGNGEFSPYRSLRVPEFIVRWAEALGEVVQISDDGGEVISSAPEENGSGAGIDPIHDSEQIEFSSGTVYTYRLGN